jgi:Flp pilus assembly pilin Flp
MIGYLNKKRAQSTLEYAVLMVVIIGALIAIQVYLKRGVQGKLKSSADDIGDQFSPGNTNLVSVETSHSEQIQSTGAAAGGQGMSKTEITAESTNSTSAAVIADDKKENWGQ